MIKVAGLYKSYIEAERRHQIFTDSEFTMGKGEAVALLGPSGSGKSTLLNLIAGIESADQGSIVVNGLELQSMSEKQRTEFRRKDLGIIFQFFNLIPTLTVEENVLLPIQLCGAGHLKDSAIARLSRLAMQSSLKRFPEQLSGGEQQRVAIARALAHSPKLIIADEPTGNLDQQTAENVIDVLIELVRNEGASLFMVTHNPLIAQRADRILQIEDMQLKQLDKASW